MQLTKERKEPVWAIGLMSGTSLDGIDAALLKTNGEEVTEFGATYALEYSDAFRKQLHDLINQQTDSIDSPESYPPRLRGGQGGGTRLSHHAAKAPPSSSKAASFPPASGWDKVEHKLTLLHAQAVKALLAKANMQPEDVAYIGFHGQTIWHKPQEGKTCQIGDGALLAAETGIPVINDFRSNDMKHGGQGAPLVPVFHQALVQDLPKPVVILNIGGVANVTWIGEQDELIAFDTGPGNALINDWVSEHTGQAYDEGGKLASQGQVDEALVSEWLTHEYFSKAPPKSLDRNDFSEIASPFGRGKISLATKEPKKSGEGLVASSPHPNPLPQGEGVIPLESGAATLTEFTARSIAAARQHFPAQPKTWYICGGGAKNAHLMNRLTQLLDAPVAPIHTIGYNGDMLEAQAFAYLALRSVRGLPLTFPGTTGAREAVSGGVINYMAGRSGTPNCLDM